MTPTLAGIRFDRSTPAFRIAQSRVLVDLLDQERLNALVADVARAREVATEAARMANSGTDSLADLIDAGIRDGMDAAKLVTAIVKARSDSAARKDAADWLNHAAYRYTLRLEGWLADQAFDLIDVLSDRMDDLLDRAGEVADALGGIDNADDATEADLGPEWKKYHKLHAEYVDIRNAQVELLRVDKPGEFGSETDTLAFAFFASPTRAWPHLGAAHHGHVRTGGLDAHGVPASPFDLNDPSDAGHWLAAVTRRAELGTRVVDAEHALTEHTRIIKEALPREPNGYDAGGELVEGYGSEAAVARRYIGAR